MNSNVNELRRLMEQRGIDAYLIPSSDFHGSEYVNDYFKCRSFMSGFTGSAGTLVVTRDDARLWTDGRYFLQAASQLEGIGITLMKMGEEGVPTIMEYLESAIKDGCLGFDGRVVSSAEAISYKDKFSIKCDEDLVDSIWRDRPEIKPSAIYQIDSEVSGETTASKLQRIREKMGELQADWHIISSLEDIAWLFNSRGADVDHTPVFYSFALIGKETASLYVMDKTLSHIDEAEILPYGRIYDDVKNISGTVLLDEKRINYQLLQSISQNCKIANKPDPSDLMKAIKNPAEISSTRNAHIKDGTAMVKFMYWLKNNVGNIPLSEIKAADYLESCRRSMQGCFDISFTTIAGYMDNGAIIHYAPTEETDKELKKEGFLLVDSGGQYKDGTTDITRTIVLGPITEEMKEHYTLVLKGHIQLAIAKFKKGTNGEVLDKFARKPLLDKGLNYNHGTGHGVGHILSVHEGPQSISPRGTAQDILPGMISSNEPGLYLEGKYGIRLENEILCKESTDGDLYFETITLCPFEREAIVKELLSPEELTWINEYHSTVYSTLSKALTEEEGQWLREATKEI